MRKTEPEYIRVYVGQNGGSPITFTQENGWFKRWSGVEREWVLISHYAHEQELTWVNWKSTVRSSNVILPAFIPPRPPIFTAGKSEVR